MDYNVKKKKLIISLILIMGILLFFLFISSRPKFLFSTETNGTEMIINKYSQALTIQPEYNGGQYPDLVVKNNNNFVMRLSLLENTNPCLVQCQAIINISSTLSGSLPNSFDFRDKKSNSRTLPYNLYYLNFTKQNITEPHYRDDCYNISANSTQITICNKTNDYNISRIITLTNWIRYSGETFSAGNYTIKITATKSPNESIDWSFGYNAFTSDTIRQYWAWWNNTWQFKKNITINGIVPINYSLKMVIPKVATMNPDYSDLRFVNSSDTGEIPYWIEKSNSTQATIWVKIDNNNTINMYYGNDSYVPPVSDIERAFLLGDNFNTTDKFNLYWINNSYKNGYTLLIGGNAIVQSEPVSEGYSLLQTAYNFSENYSAIIRLNVTDFSDTNGRWALGFIGAYNNPMQDLDSCGSSNANQTYIFKGHGTLSSVWRFCGTTTSDSGTLPINATSFAVYEIRRFRYNATAMNYSILKIETDESILIDSRVASIGATLPLVPLSFISSRAGYSSGSENRPTLDWVGVRKINGGIGTDPTITIGAEENPPVIIPLNITLISQNPADITTTNLLNQDVNITYNYTKYSDSFNVSSIKIYTKVNTTSSECSGWFNGTQKCGYNGWGFIGYSSNSSDTLFHFILDDNEVYPAVYNYPNHTFMEITAKSNFNANNQNSLARSNFINVSNVTLYNVAEINVQNNSATSNPLQIWYCNSSYTTGSLTSSPNCNLIGTLTNNIVANHTHGVNSEHYLIPFAIVDGKVSNLTKVTSDSGIILRGNTGGWNVRYITDRTRLNAGQTSTNLGSTFSELVGTFDMHLHQFTGNETLWYYARGLNSTNDEINSTETFDLLQLGGINPTTPIVYNPVNATYYENITINYTASFSPNGYAISYYNITLRNQDGTYNRTIQSNNSNNLSFVWIPTETLIGNFTIGVRAYDNLSQNTLGVSELFYFDSRLNPQITFATSPSSPINYGLQTNFSCYSPLITPTLTIDSVNKDSENGINISRKAGTYNINCSYDGNSTYRPYSITSTFIINIVTPSITISLEPSSSESYGTTTNASGNGCPSQIICGLFRNNISVLNPNVEILGAGIYNYNFNTTGNENYSSANVINVLTISASPTSVNTLLSPQTSSGYGNVTNFSCSNSLASMFVNNVDKTSDKGKNITRSVGVYVVNCTIPTTINYTGSENVRTYTIFKQNVTLGLSFSPNSIAILGTTTNVTGSNCPLQINCSLWRNSGYVSNPDIDTLPLGIYNYAYNGTDNVNYSLTSGTGVLTIVEAFASANMTLFTNQYPHVDWNTTYPLSVLISYNNGTSIAYTNNTIVIINITSPDGTNSSMNFTKSGYTFLTSLIFTEVGNYPFVVWQVNSTIPTGVITGTFLVRIPYYVNVEMYNLDNSSIVDNYGVITIEYLNSQQKINDQLENFIHPVAMSNYYQRTFHNDYKNGRATIKLFDANESYAIRYISGKVLFDSYYAKPNITKSYGKNIYLGTIRLNGTNMTEQFILEDKDLHPFRWLANWIVILLFVIIGAGSITLFFVFPDKPQIAFVFGFLFSFILIGGRLAVWFWTGN